jgi:hypothetical protein
MNLFHRLFGGFRDPEPPETMRVFLTRAAKWRALCESVRASLDAGERVLVVAHFPATLREADSHLSAAGITTSIQDRPLTAHEVAERGGPALVLLVSMLALVVADETQTTVVTGHSPLSLFIPEMHPLHAAEENVHAFAAAIPGQVRMFSFVSLEDPLMDRTCGPWVRDVLRQLGMQEHEELESPLITRQVRQAQAKVSRQVASFVPADSAEEWVEHNLPVKT